VTADKNPLEDAVDQALDAFVYAPIGLLFDGPARFPDLIRNGRSQVTNARMMGQFAVQMGRTEVTKRTAELDGPVVDLLRGLGVLDGPPPGPAPAPTPTPEAVPDKPDAPAAKEAAKKRPAPKKPAAKQAATKKATKKKAARKATAPAAKAAPPSSAGLAITDYDSLSASQVVSRLQGLSTAELEAVRSYEAATRGRKTILNRVQQLQKP
jgi:outer membrane biosynthesis protein TonB